MTLFDYLNEQEQDYDAYDKEYDISISAVYSDNLDNDYYDKFCTTLYKKVQFVFKVDNYTIVADWSDLIMRNKKKFEDFSLKWWGSFSEDRDRFIKDWLNDFKNFVSGYAEDDFYEPLFHLVDSLE